MSSRRWLRPCSRPGERWRRFRRRVQIAWRILRGPAYPLYPEPPRE